MTTAQGNGHVDAATGEMLAFVPHSLSRQVYETIYMLHTGQGLWPLALILGLTALAVPGLSTAGAFIWWKRRSALPRIRQNVGAQSADMIILVGSEGNSTWGFAVTLHAALTKAGHRVYTAPMNRLAPAYARAADTDLDRHLWRWSGAGFGQSVSYAAGATKARCPWPVLALATAASAFLPVRRGCGRRTSRQGLAHSAEPQADRPAISPGLCPMGTAWGAQSVRN